MNTGHWTTAGRIYIFVNVKLYMKFSEDLAAVHAYLCSDGMVKQFGKHYQIKFTNITPELLNDFNVRFFREFNIKPKEYWEEHICKLLVFNKNLFFELMKFGPYDSRNWETPLKFLKKDTIKMKFLETLVLCRRELAKRPLIL